MKLLHTALVIATLFGVGAIGAIPVTAAQPAAAQPEAPLPGPAAEAAYEATGEMIVRYEAGKADEAIAECKERGLVVKEVHGPGNLLLCGWPKEVKAVTARTELLKSKAIVYIIPNAPVSIPPLQPAGKAPLAPREAPAAAAPPALEAKSTSVSGYTGAGAPNDPFLNKLWGMSAINADKAWGCAREAKVVVAVLDTGIDYNHEDLAANMRRNPYEVPGDGLDNDGNGVVDDVFGFNTFTGGGDPMDRHGHGTHCAGTIGGVGNNGLGVVGVNWKVQLLAVKVLNDNGSGSTFGLVKGIDYAWRAGAKVMSASLGWQPGTPRALVLPVREAISRAEVAGAVFVAAAGNNYRNNNDTRPVYPASFGDPSDPDGALGNVISVAAININQQPSNFTNVGKRSVHLAAPGGEVKFDSAGAFFTDETDILSSVAATNTFGPNFKREGGGKYAYLPGTSMATPHVSGAIALVWSRPEYSGLSGREIKGLVLSKARRVDALKGLCATEAILDLGFVCAGDADPPCPPIIICPVPCPPSCAWLPPSRPKCRLFRR
ncbi:Intracellular serine protease [Gemmata sp. SH-PL17]|uniref:S8 family peptidase n=1 Tax=Gemmata sp. SH-PL17 TaxID=1630693 RepID=UPI00078E17B9|nr:S8 family peptidase [Gemmata sp. SH-PL17]AMV24039.1 Intracellular serine protease [Gemmata sp. SH-PL17]